jgi:hypothetical protein
MPRRRRRKRRNRNSALRVVRAIGQGALVVLFSVAVGYAFYLTLQWVAAEAAR